MVESKNTIDNYNINAILEVGNFVLGNISYRNIKDGYQSDNKAKNNIDMRTKIGDIVFNRGEGAILENEEYLTNDTKIKDSEDNALEKNVNRTEKENKKREEDMEKENLDENAEEENDENIEEEENN